METARVSLIRLLLVASPFYPGVLVYLPTHSICRSAIIEELDENVNYLSQSRFDDGCGKPFSESYTFCVWPAVPRITYGDMM